MDIGFKGKRALVTGGGRGIGRAIAQRLVDYGATVFVIDRLPENLASLKSQIRVNSVGPTVVITDMTKETFSDPDVQTAFKANMPLGRLTEIGDIVNTIMFLLSDKATNITGSMVPVDGEDERAVLYGIARIDIAREL